MEDQFYYADADSQPVGPLSLDEIRRFAEAGVVPPDVMICEAGGDDWRHLTAFAAPPRTAPPPSKRSTSRASAAPKHPGTPLETQNAAGTARSLHLHLSHAIVAVILFFFVDMASRSAASANGGVDPSGGRQLFAGLTALWAGAAELILVFNICRALPDHLRFTTPAKAALFMIIPGFNIYWAFRLLPGFAEATARWNREADSTASQQKPAPDWLLPVSYVSASVLAVSTVLTILEVIGAVPLTETGSLILAVDYAIRFTVYITVVGVIRGIVDPEASLAHTGMELTDDGKTPKILLWWCNDVWPKIWACLIVIFFIVTILKHFGVIDL